MAIMKKKWSNKPLASVEEKRRINNENDTKTRGVRRGGVQSAETPASKGGKTQ
mgnify:CR=1 FL=1